MRIFEQIVWLACIGATTIHHAEAFDDIERLNRLIAMAPSSELYFSRANEHSRRGKHSEAIVDLELALSLKPSEYRYLITKAFELNRLSRFAESEAVCAVAASMNCNRTLWPEVVLRVCNRKKVKLSK